MKTQAIICVLASIVLLTACQTGRQGDQGDGSHFAVYQQQWDADRLDLLETLRRDPHLRVVEREDGSIYIQIRSVHAYTIGRTKPAGEVAEALNHIASAVQGRNHLRITIQGHSDNVGQPAHNQILSEKRAKEVFDYLKIQGVQQDMKYEGLGAEQPIASNNTREGRAVNRRVDVLIQAR